MGKQVNKVTFRPMKINISDDVRKILPKIGEQGADEVRWEAPVGYTEEYAEGWTSEMEGQDTVVIYNDGKHKSLSHLLELGHLSKSGGWVPPQEHIRPAYKKTEEKFIEELKNINIEPK